MYGFLVIPGDFFAAVFVWSKVDFVHFVIFVSVFMSSAGAVLPLSASAGSGPIRVRRIFGKQKCPWIKPPALRVSPCEDQHKSLNWSSAKEFDSLDHKKKRNRIYFKFKWWISQVDFSSLSDEPFCSVDLLRLSKNSAVKLSRDQMAQSLRYFLKWSKAPRHVMKFAKETWKLAHETIDQDGGLRGHSFLFTYNGNWGVIGKLSDEERQLSTAAQETLVRESFQAVRIWQSLKMFVMWLVEQLQVEYWAMSLELCMQTLQAEGVIRVHSHVFLRSREKMHIGNSNMLMFNGSKAFLKDRVFGRHLQKNCFSAMYYLLCPKIGKVFSMGSHERFKQFPVNPDWVFSVVEKEKMTYEDALTEVVSCVRGCERRVRDLKCWYKHKQEFMLAKKVEEDEILARSKLKQFPKHKIAENWMKEVQEVGQDRKRILVLDGKSRVGKTQYARSLWPVGQVLELNCSQLSTPVLNAFDALQHKCILWDEASPKLVCDHRKVFQHQVGYTDLGHSPTGAHVIRIPLGFSCSIITSNSWRASVEKLSNSEKDWLEANVVLFVVESPLWEKPS